MSTILRIRDVLTNLEIYTRPNHARANEEDKAMYERHFDIKTVEIYIEECTQPMYQPPYKKNPANAYLKEEKSAFTVVTKDPTKPHNGTWVVKHDHLKEEVLWVGDMLDTFANEMYYSNPENALIAGSLHHRGMINILFNYRDCPNIAVLRKCIKLIDDSGIEQGIKNIHEQHSRANEYSIYVNGLFTPDVKNLCEYCEVMYGVSRFKVAGYFTKVNPEYFAKKLGRSPSDNRYFMFRIGAVYAESGYYELALQMMDDGLLMCKNSFSHNFENTRNNLVEYYKNYGTSVLSSKR